MATAIKYIITDDHITFFKDNEIRSIQQCNGLKGILFQEIKRCLLDGDKEIPAFNHQDAIKMLRARPQLSKPINDRIQALEEAGLPTEPLHRFLENCPEHILNDLEVLSKVGTSAMPLTWDGDVVLYQRSHFNNGSAATSWTHEDGFIPGQVVDKEQSVSSFDHIVNGVCPDAGPVFEVIVKAKDIVSAGTNNIKSLWKVKKLTQMSKLGLRPSANTKAESGIVEFLTNCVGGNEASVRVPYNAGTAAKMVNSLFTHNSEALNNIVPVRSAVAFC
jgi:hypothetical protein